jgi:hypothetical protein
MKAVRMLDLCVETNEVIPVTPSGGLFLAIASPIGTKEPRLPETEMKRDYQRIMFGEADFKR